MMRIEPLKGILVQGSVDGAMARAVASGAVGTSEAVGLAGMVRTADAPQLFPSMPVSDSRGCGLQTTIDLAQVTRHDGWTVCIRSQV